MIIERDNKLYQRGQYFINNKMMFFDVQLHEAFDKELIDEYYKTQFNPLDHEQSK